MFAKRLKKSIKDEYKLKLIHLWNLSLFMWVILILLILILYIKLCIGIKILIYVQAVSLIIHIYFSV